MPDQVPHPVKRERMERLVELVQRRARERAQRFVGRTMEVLVEGPSRTDPARLRGRTRHNKTVNFEGTAEPGELVEVEIAGGDLHHPVRARAARARGSGEVPRAAGDLASPLDRWSCPHSSREAGPGRSASGRRRRFAASDPPCDLAGRLSRPKRADRLCGIGALERGGAQRDLHDPTVGRGSDPVDQQRLPRPLPGLVGGRSTDRLRARARFEDGDLDHASQRSTPAPDHPPRLPSFLVPRRAFLLPEWRSDRV